MGGGDSSVGKSSASHAADTSPGFDSGHNILHEREGKRLPAVKSYCTS